MAAATITLKLDVIPGATAGQGKVLVPGQEPPSDATSNTLLAYMKGKAAVCPVEDILKAIPGTYLLYADNWANNVGVRKRWLVFPPYDPNCCTAMVDYYQIIRNLAKIEEPEEERMDACDVFGTGAQPGPDWENVPPPAPDPYLPEGGSQYGYINYSAGNPPPWAVPTPPTGKYRDEHG